MKNTRWSALLVLAFSLVSASAFAEDSVDAVMTESYFNFTIRSMTSLGGDVYYNCSSVESFVEDTLAKLGATDISVRCSGGFDTTGGFPPMDAYVDVKFKSLILAPPGSTEATVPATWTTVSFNSDDCYLATTVFDKVGGNFELRDVTGMSCTRLGQRFRATVTTLSAVR